jgi:hypothetical protein
MTEARPQIPETFDEMAWSDLQKLGSAYGLTGKKEEIVAGLELERRGGRVYVGQIVTYRDHINGRLMDARVSLVRDEDHGIVNLAVFSVGGSQARHRPGVAKGQSGGCWWPKEAGS